jgi:hypothetical protein
VGSPSFAVAVALFAPVAVVGALLLDVLLLRGRKEAPWDAFEKFVGQLGSAVVKRF